MSAPGTVNMAALQGHRSKQRFLFASTASKDVIACRLLLLIGSQLCAYHQDFCSRRQTLRVSCLIELMLNERTRNSEYGISARVTEVSRGAFCKQSKQRRHRLQSFAAA